MKKIIYLLLVFIGVGFVSCSEDDLGPSIFEQNPQPKNEFDKWIEDSIRSQYNIAIIYRWQDVESDMKYNLIPVEYEKAFRLAKLVKFLWLDSYDEITGDEQFIGTYAPSILQLIGSSEINASTKTEVLGLAEGGVKITLFKVNELDFNNLSVDKLNEDYFKTMHHEFAHILHQTKNFPTSFKTLTPSTYSPEGWQTRTKQEAWEMGYVTPYASKEASEDFVEIIANYLVRPQYWNEMLAYNKTDLTNINKKFEIARDWLESAWNIDIDKLRSIIERRSAQIKNI